MHIGLSHQSGGRIGEAASIPLSQQLPELGLEIRRLKTGTPARLKKNTINYDLLEVQPTDTVPTFLSFMTDKIYNNQIDCHITATSPISVT